MDRDRAFTSPVFRSLARGLDETYWKFASQMFEYLYNRLPHAGNDGGTC